MSAVRIATCYDPIGFHIQAVLILRYPRDIVLSHWSVILSRMSRKKNKISCSSSNHVFLDFLNAEKFNAICLISLV